MKVTPKEMQEKLKDKFDQDYNYQTVANIQKKLDLKMYGNPTEDAENLKQLILNLKEGSSDFLGEILKVEKTNELKAIVYATPVMKDLANSFFDVVIIDTTVGTNKF